LGKDEARIKNEIDGFNSIAKNYLPTSKNKQVTPSDRVNRADTN